MTDWDAGEPPTSWDVVIPTDDAAVSRRRRALAPIQALNDLERNKASYDGDFWDGYDLFNIALAVIDQVALAMGISAGRTWDDALDYASVQAARQVPGDAPEVHAQVAERVLVALVTTDVVTVPYLAHEDTGPTWKGHRFRLLFAHPSGPDGTEHLRASEQAINIFVSALDLDIEEAQIANEAQLRALIERGAVGSATQLAQIAQYQSAQYLEKTRRIVADTFLDPGGHDWVHAVPKLLSAALTHVQDRLAAEAALAEALTDQRSEVDDSDALSHINDLLQRLRDCRQRHSELHGHLIDARSRHRTALEGRLARPPQVVHRVDVGKDLLAPYLERSTAIAAGAAERMIACVGGLAPRWWPSLAVMTDDLCAPGREPALGEAYLEPTFDDSDQVDWWERYEELAEAVLAEIATHAQLSELLARAAVVAEHATGFDGEALDARLVRVAVVHAAHRAWAAQVTGRPVEGSFLVATTGPGTIEEEGVRCNDLIVVRASLTDEPATDAALTHSLEATA